MHDEGMTRGSSCFNTCKFKVLSEDMTSMTSLFKSFYSGRVCVCARRRRRRHTRPLKSFPWLVMAFTAVPKTKQFKGLMHDEGGRHGGRHALPNWWASRELAHPPWENRT
jgi:hypothetical protein